MPQSFHSKQSGFTIVELMVGVLIGLIATVVIFQVYAVSEGHKRTSTSGNDAQTNGMLALYTIERDLRLAGYGINLAEFLGCNIRWYDQRKGGPQLGFSMVPVRITQGGGTAPDTISIMYGNSEMLGFPAAIVQDMPSPSSVFKVNNSYGIDGRNGDLIIAAEAGKDCTMAQITDFTGGENAHHGSGNYTPPSGGSPLPAYYNAPGGLGVAYSKYNSATKTGGRLFNIGSAPNNNIFRVSANAQLTFQNLITTVPEAAIYDGIVNLQARYGKDTDGNGIIETWDEVTPVTPTDWSRILAVQVAIVARSALEEKDAVSPATIEMLPAIGAAPKLDYNLTAAERRFRYRVFYSVIPLRNLIWAPSL